jgi:spermidine/putrescine transport system substrate-binding protein
MRKIIIFLIFLGILLAGLGGLFLLKKLRQPPLERELNIFNWENYLSEEVVRDFEKKYQVKVNLETFDDSESMFSVVQSQPDKYDLVVVPDDLISLMKNLKLLSPLNHQKIPNLKYLKREAKENHYDPGNVYCVPYVNGYTGIAVNTKYIKNYDGTRSILWDENYRGRISMLNNAEEILFSILLYLGYSNIDKLSPEELDSVLNQAIDLAIKQKDLVLGYDDPIKQRELLVNEEAWVAYIYTTEIADIKQRNPNIEFFAPKEGVSLWSDNFCIPKDAPHKEVAHAFLNYLLDPKVSAKNSQDIKALMVNGEMKKFLDPNFYQLIEGLDFPKEKEIFEKSRYYNFRLNIKIQTAVNRLAAELRITE